MPGHSKTTARCNAYARSTGRPCRAKAMANGRCKLHGGTSTGPKTPEGRRKALACLPWFRDHPERVEAAIRKQDERRAKQSGARLSAKLGRPEPAPGAVTELVQTFLKEAAKEQARHYELAERLKRARMQ